MKLVFVEWMPPATGQIVGKRLREESLPIVEARRRQATRRKRLGPRTLRAHLGEPTVLDLIAVSEPTRLDDSPRLEEFWSFAEQWNVGLETDMEFDEVLADWADSQFLDRDQCHVGERLKAAPVGHNLQRRGPGTKWSQTEPVAASRGTHVVSGGTVLHPACGSMPLSSTTNPQKPTFSTKLSSQSEPPPQSLACICTYN